MFINLSNHPTADWSGEQLAAARRYGEVVDLPFPSIAPEYTKEDILQLVEEYVASVLKMKQGDLTVHVMGEMTFTHNLVNALHEKGIVCVASTTVRNAVMTADGRKVSEFRFVQFREY